MSMSFIQIIILIFAVFVLTRVVYQFKKRAVSITWLVFWIVFWSCAATVAVLPQTADALARFVGVGRGADVVVYFSLAALFYIVFRIYVKIEQVEREITRVVRARALDNAKNELTKK